MVDAWIVKDFKENNAEELKEQIIPVLDGLIKNNLKKDPRDFI